MSPRKTPWLLAFVLATGCSLVVDQNTTQCVVDTDCDQFDMNHPFCQDGVCVASGLGPPGCFYGMPMTQDQFANQCTTATTLSFDNCKRLGLCTADALASAMSISSAPVAGTVTGPINNEPMPTLMCATDVPNPIFITGSTNL